MRRTHRLLVALLLSLALNAPAALAQDEGLSEEEIKAREAAALKKAMTPAKTASTPAPLGKSPVPLEPTWAQVWELHTKEGADDKAKLELWGRYLEVVKLKHKQAKYWHGQVKKVVAQQLLEEAKELYADASLALPDKLAKLEALRAALGRGKEAKAIGRLARKTKKAYIADLRATADTLAADQASKDADVVAAYTKVIEVAGTRSRDGRLAQKEIDAVGERKVRAPFALAKKLHKDRTAAVEAKIAAWQKVVDVGGETKWGKKAAKMITALRIKELKARYKGAARAGRSRKADPAAMIAAWKAVDTAAAALPRKGAKFAKKARQKIKKWRGKLYKKLDKMDKDAALGRADKKQAWVAARPLFADQSAEAVYADKRIEELRAAPAPAKVAPTGPKTVEVPDETAPAPAKRPEVAPPKQPEVAPPKQPVVAPASAPPTRPALAAGTSAPPFTLRTLNKEASGMKLVNLGHHVGERAKTPKKAVLMSFFADYCAPCKKEMPLLEKLYGEYKDQGLLVLAVCIDKKAPELEKVKAFLAEQKLTLPVVSDKMNIVARRYQVERLPAVYFVGPDGKVSSSKFGYEEGGGEAYLRGQVARMLGVSGAPKAVAPVRKAATKPADDDEDEDDEDEDE